MRIFLACCLLASAGLALAKPVDNLEQELRQLLDLLQEKKPNQEPNTRNVAEKNHHHGHDNGGHHHKKEQHEAKSPKHEEGSSHDETSRELKELFDLLKKSHQEAKKSKEEEDEKSDDGSGDSSETSRDVSSDEGSGDEESREFTDRGGDDDKSKEETDDILIESDPKASKENMGKKSVREEFDMVIGKKEWNEVKKIDNDKNLSPLAKRKAITKLFKFWPHGEVPYEFHSSASKGAKRVFLKKAIKEYDKYTCIKFRPKKSGDKNWISIKSNQAGCFANVGKKKGLGKQGVNLGNGCAAASVVIHELGHTLGLWHEQSRPDRDQYLDIVWDHVPKKFKHNFKIHGTANTMGIPYDFRSIMHYGRHAFNTHHEDTIHTKDPKMQDIIGHMRHLSYDDIKVLTKMYHDCTDSCPPISCPTSGFVGKDCKCWCEPANHEQVLPYDHCKGK